MAAPVSDQGGQNDEGGVHQDSLTLGQLKQLTSAFPKPRKETFAFRYDDTDTILAELDEFYSYVEVPAVLEARDEWVRTGEGEWTKMSQEERRELVRRKLDGLDAKDTGERLAHARKLLYILQGTFAETTSPEHQLHWVIENAKTVRAASPSAIPAIVDALKAASAQHEWLSLEPRELSAQERAELTEDVNAEIATYFAMLYFVVEVFRGEEAFRDELMDLDPPLPTYLFTLVAALRDKTAKGYPVKKLLLLLWKTLLACLGGMRDIERVKKLSRELSGLAPSAEPPADSAAPFVKTTPLDFDTFRHEMAVKYPTFAAAPEAGSTSTSYDRLASAIAPIPVRPSYHDRSGTSSFAGFESSSSGVPAPAGPLPATPAPTPPPSPAPPKPKKQQFQTDQSKPFVFPFSAAAHGARFVPYSIEEAGQLYARHMHVSTGLWQMWAVREECIAEEGPVGYKARAAAAAAEEEGEGERRRKEKEEERERERREEEERDPLKALRERDAGLEREVRDAEESGDKARVRCARERRSDLKRLMRIEVIYRAILPTLQNSVIVLLKLLLATVTANGPNPNAQAGPNGVFTEDDQPPPTLEDIDVMRHREITSKAVSAIILLMLKWFKASHVMKFHWLGTLLVDSNCLLLILKMFGLQEVSVTVRAKNEVEDSNFFRYCLLHGSSSPHAARPEDDVLGGGGGGGGTQMTIVNGEEVNLITDYSWRNFFASVNFTRILQKLSKRRTHRVLLLVQYKSSAILKRILKVSHPLLQLYVLKVIKGQVPYCGRKWRQSNMKVITAIYLNCRPDLRDEWLAGADVDADIEESLPQEQALRSLIRFYNTKHYGFSGTAQPGGHRRASSQLGAAAPFEDLRTSPEGRRVSVSSNRGEDDVFPPPHARPSDQASLAWMPDDIFDMHDYEDVLHEIFGGLDEEQYDAHGHEIALRELNLDKLDRDSVAWNRLAEMLGPDIADDISDSESIVTVGDLGEPRQLDNGREGDVPEENPGQNNWEHISAQTLAKLPPSPSGPQARRRSSGGSNLRPVLPFGLEDATAAGSAVADEDAAQPLPPPEGNPPATHFAGGAGGLGVDEVEYLYGE